MTRSLRRPFAVGVFLLLPAPVAISAAQAPELVRDLRPGPADPALESSATVSFDGIATAGGRLYLLQTEPVHGSELWTTDGTRAGTRLVRDLVPGSEGSILLPFLPLGESLLFGTGRELWASDGSPAGTRLLRRSTTAISQVVRGDAHAFFVACGPNESDPPELDCALWRTDGTPEGTTRVAGPSWSAASSTTALAIAADHDRVAVAVDLFDSGSRLWVLDVLKGGGVEIPLGEPSTAIESLAATADGFLYSLVGPAGRSLAFTDGTLDATRELFPQVEGSAYHLAAGRRDGQTFFFRAIAQEPAAPVDCTLFLSDGSVARTAAVTTLDGTFGCPLTGVVTEAGRLFFPHRTLATGSELWTSDGTAQGTRPLDLVPGPSGSTPGALSLTDRGVVFQSTSLEGVFLAPSTGGAPTLLLPGAQLLNGVAPIGEALWLSARSTETFRHLLASSSTPGEPAAVVLEAEPGPASSSPNTLAVRRSDAVLLATLDPTRRAVPHTTDATHSGTRPLVTDTAPFRRLPPPVSLAALPNAALWFNDGTPPGSRFSLLGDSPEDERPILGLYDVGLDALRIDDRLVFAANDVDGYGAELFVTDGTLEGTGLFADVLSVSVRPGRPPCSSFARAPTRVGDRLATLWFRPQNVECGSPVEALSLLDLDGSNVRDVLGFPPSSPPPPEGSTTAIAAAGRRLFVGWSFESLFHVEPGARESAVSWLPPRPPGREARTIAELGELRGRLAYRVTFAEREPPPGPRLVTEELWLTDGTALGSTRLLALEDELPSVQSWQLTTVGDRLFFTPQSRTHGVELWSSEGLTDDGRLVDDLTSGPESSFPHDLRSVDGRLLFTAATPETGSELWQLADAADRPSLLPEVARGPESGDPAEATPLGDRVLVAATRSDVGRELFAFDRAALLPGCSEEPVTGSVCLSERFRVSVDWLDRATGERGRAVGAPLTRDTASFWFFEEDNVELLVKVLDGRVLNDNHWVYTGAVSDIAYWVTVFDTLTGETTTYENEQGSQCGVGDVDALPEDPERAALFGLVEPLSPGDPPVPGLDNASATCEPSATRLCLQGGRFAVEVAHFTRSDDPDPSEGIAVPATEDSGYFWFFSPENVELVVKVLDGRAANGSFWVYSGALSDVEYEITVTDTVSGITELYSNPAGSQCGIADVGAFPP